MATANEWTRAKLAEWGLENAAVEPWGTFGKSWTLDRAALHLVEPYYLPIPALPKAWTPGTRGKVKGDLLRVTLATSEDLAKWKGKLAGKILLLDDAEESQASPDPLVDRHDDQELAEMCHYELPTTGGNWREEAPKRWRFRQEVRAFLVAEKVVATLEVSSRESTLVRVGGDSFAYEPGAAPGTGAGGLLRALQPPGPARRAPGRVATARAELLVDAELGTTDQVGANTVAELPGSDLADELVLLGGHLDSWHGGTGATDNAAGVAMAMEAVRILTALGVQPRRTIRVVLWSGEEQGLLGSRAYVEKHFARGAAVRRARATGASGFPAQARGPWEFLPGHAKVAAYFNLDNAAARCGASTPRRTSG